MLEEVREWVTKADRDYKTMLREYKAIDSPNYDDTCFHAQQCSEKLLKALLIQADKPFSKTHDLRLLLQLLIPFISNLDHLLAPCSRISEYAVAFRYPDEESDISTALRAIQDCVIIRNTLMPHLLPDHQPDLPFLE